MRMCGPSLPVIIIIVIIIVIIIIIQHGLHGLEELCASQSFSHGTVLSDTRQG